MLLRTNDDPRLGPPFLSHLSYQEYLKYSYLSSDLLNQYYKFTVTRNPYSRLESLYHYRGYSSALTFRDFIRNVVTKENKIGAQCHFYFKPQVDYLVDYEGRIQVNDIFKLEKLDEILPVLQKIGLDITFIPHVNKSKSPGFLKKIYQRIRIMGEGYGSLHILPNSHIEWDDDLVNTVNCIYDSDFSMLGYYKK